MIATDAVDAVAAARDGATAWGFGVRKLCFAPHPSTTYCWRLPHPDDPLHSDALLVWRLADAK